MIKAANLQRGQVVKLNGKPFQTKHIDVQTPSARGANTLYKVRFAGIPDQQKMEHTFKGTDTLEEMELEKRPVSFLYSDADFYVFMDSNTYEQYSLNRASLEEQGPWLTEGMEGIVAFVLNEQILCVEVPLVVEVEIAEAAPSIKGATAMNRNKPALLVNGVTVQVPEYIAPGNVIRVNTQTNEYISRVRD
jgi:elongation factor P